MKKYMNHSVSSLSVLSLFLFHHQTSTCIENVMFRQVNVDYFPELVPGSKRFHLLPGTVKVVPQKTAADQITHRRA